ncbi:transposase [Panacagrimonas sp.]|uniref:transposase n=1 Tax=Panacagrimonas sp. TaxID=2480088 RepID=UPI003B52918E
MARLPRLVVPGEPHHVELRGNGGVSICRDDDDRRHWVTTAADAARGSGTDLHAYCLLEDRAHLLLTPATCAALPQMMQALGRRYVQYFNRRHQRNGTLWEGRYRGAPLQAELYLLDCMHYLDSLPVLAGLVVRPERYGWSSCAHYSDGTHDPAVVPHALLWTLGNTPFEREARYLERLRRELPPAQREAITTLLLRGWPLGDPTYLAALADRTQRRVVRRHAGRPRRQARITPDGPRD